MCAFKLYHKEVLPVSNNYCLYYMEVMLPFFKNIWEKRHTLSKTEYHACLKNLALSSNAVCPHESCRVFHRCFLIVLWKEVLPFCEVLLVFSTVFGRKNTRFQKRNTMHASRTLLFQRRPCPLHFSQGCFLTHLSSRYCRLNSHINSL